MTSHTGYEAHLYKRFLITNLNEQQKLKTKPCI